MGWNNYTDEQKAVVEKHIRERAVRDGLDPDERWKWFMRLQDGKPVMISEMVDYLCAEAKRQGWYDDCNLDYEASHPFEDREVTSDMTHMFIPNFGGSEGIYLDWDAKDWNGEKPVQFRVSCWKTLETSAKAMEAMGRLAGRLTYLANTIL